MGRIVRRAMWSVAAVAGIAIAAPFVVPVSPFIPELTRAASDRLGQPVTMEDLRLHLVPRPRIVGHRITVGRRSQVLIGELEIEPDLLSLVFGPRTVRLIRAERVAIDAAVLAMRRGIPRRPAGEPVLVHRVILSTVKLNHARVDLPIFDVDVRLGEGLRLIEASFATRDGTLKLLAQPSGEDATAVQLRATGWTLPVGAPLVFDSLSAQGRLAGRQLELARIEGELYGGKLVGAAQAAWGKQWLLAGKAELAGVDLVPVQKALGKQAKLSGRLRADAAFSTRAKTPAGLREALALDGPFEVLGGLYQGVDLSRAGDLTGEGGAGAATSFEELKGNLELRGYRVTLSELCVRSPQLVAGGNVEIAPDRTLSGRLDISLAQTGGILGVPVSLGGTTDQVTMRPTKGYLIGAAIGTVLMPGIGTSIGSSLGGRIEGTSDCK